MKLDPRLRLKTQVMCGNDFAMGPGKAALLDAIAVHGSISAAGRALGMSYRRTWLLADTLNRTWSGPLIATAHGGKAGGGATLTPLGLRVLANYRALEAALGDAAAIPANTLLADLATQPRLSQKV